MSRRAKRPLDKKAVKAADKELYARHANDPRPNALYDADGNKKKLSASDPSQAALRKEWMDLYLANEGKEEEQKKKKDSPKKEDPPPPEQEIVTDPNQECIEPPADLVVHVKWTPLPKPVERAMVKIEGPVTMEQMVDSQGVAEFRGIPPGGYTVEASLDSGYPVADKATKQIGSTKWAHAKARDPYPKKTNKCNLFVYEMANAAGHTVPKRERWSWKELEDVWYPPLAGQWATATESIGRWKFTDSPRPGDAVARAQQYADASGHVGIHGYPEPSGLSTNAPAGQETTVEIELQRETISDNGHKVVHNDWGWRAGQTGVKYRRYVK